MTAFKPTEKQIANLTKLADFLDTAPIDPDQFSMRDYYKEGLNSGVSFCVSLGSLGPVKVTQMKHRCGTSACAIGWGPVATGIRPKKFESWWEYAGRVFGTSDSSTKAGAIMFGPYNPDCPHEAAIRIREILSELDAGRTVW